MKLQLLILAGLLPLVLAADSIEVLQDGQWEETITMVSYEGTSPDATMPKPGEKNTRTRCIDPDTSFQKFIERQNGPDCKSLEPSRYDALKGEFSVNIQCGDSQMSGALGLSGKWTKTSYDINLVGSLKGNKGGKSFGGKVVSTITGKYIGKCQPEEVFAEEAAGATVEAAPAAKIKTKAPPKKRKAPARSKPR